jgi:hypothetical protein
MCLFYVYCLTECSEQLCEVQIITSTLTDEELEAIEVKYFPCGLSVRNDKDSRLLHY